MKEYEKVFELVSDGKKEFSTAEYCDRNPLHLAKLIGRGARAKWLQEDIEGAISAYEEALMEAKDLQLETDLKDLKKIKVDKEKLDYINPEIGDQHREKGNNLFKEGKFVESLKEFDEALARNPKDHKTYCNKAAAFVKLMEFNQALVMAEKSIELDPNYTKAHIRKANIHHFLKEYHKAIETWDFILKLEPENAEAQKGKHDTQMKIAMSMHDGNDEERLKRAMADPEIQSIMCDPMVKIALQQMQTNPKEAQSYFNDNTLGPKLQKLIQAGVLKVG